jgi:hypothetical protein
MSSLADPFAALGLPSTATLDEVRAARRRLAKELHPDHGGDPAAMRDLNSTFDAAVKSLLHRDKPSVAAADLVRVPTDDKAGRAFMQSHLRWFPNRRVEHDNPSFTIHVLPAEAFEALLVVTSWLGDVISDDPPYLLEAQLNEPGDCWVRLELVPDAGASTVSVTVVSNRADVVSADDVRDCYVRAINSLGDLPS